MVSGPTRTGTAAIGWAKAQVTRPIKNFKGLCLQFTRMCYGVGAYYPSAKAAWDGAKYKHRTSNANSIPAGVPVYWATSSRYDHVAISAGNGYCYSTDIKRSGRVDRVSINSITRAWGPLLGWTEDLNGVRVYRKTTTSSTSKKPTYLSKLKYGQRDSESVKNLQRALNAHKMPGGTNMPVTGNYLSMTDDEVRLCQRLHGFGPTRGSSDPEGKSYVGPKQAKHLGLPDIR